VHPVDKDNLRIIRKKHRLWNRCCESGNPDIDKRYKKQRNLVRKESRKRERNFQYEIAKISKTEPKKFWKYVRSKKETIIGVADIIRVNEDGSSSKITNDNEKATVFAEYFSKVFTVEGEGSFDRLYPIHIVSPMPELEITASQVELKLKKLKLDKSPGPDQLHPRVLYEVRELISGPLQLLFDKSINSGELPEDWKLATVVAIHKKGNKSDVKNYRPVSLTCILCKVMESFIRDHIMEHFFINKLFTNKQYGFIKGRSTALQLLALLDKWTQDLEEGGQVDVLYTDFEKAFDKVPHRRLIAKLEDYGIRVDIINWIKGFLFNRKQQVKINGSYSKWSPVISGIPQGSILGPLLFIIYINDLPEIIEKFANMALFADDAKISKHIVNKQDSSSLQMAFTELYKWSEKWMLKLNIGKCKVLSLSRTVPEHNSYTINIGGSMCTLERVEKMNDLGVLLDDKLQFAEHIHDKVNKAYRMLGVIKRNFRHMDKDTFVNLYKSLVRSQLEYASSVWSPYKKKYIEEIEKVQKRATKMVIGCKKLSYIDRLKYLDLHTLKMRRWRGDMIEVFKILTRKYDENDVVLPHLEKTNIRQTRGNTYKLETRRARYDLRKYYFADG
jgi:hypothetical protein